MCSSLFRKGLSREMFYFMKDLEKYLSKIDTKHYNEWFTNLYTLNLNRTDWYLILTGMRLMRKILGEKSSKEFDEKYPMSKDEQEYYQNLPEVK